MLLFECRIAWVAVLITYRLPACLTARLKGQAIALLADGASQMHSTAPEHDTTDLDLGLTGNKETSFVDQYDFIQSIKYRLLYIYEPSRSDKIRISTTDSWNAHFLPLLKDLNPSQDATVALDVFVVGSLSPDQRGGPLPLVTQQRSPYHVVEFGLTNDFIGRELRIDVRLQNHNGTTRMYLFQLHVFLWKSACLQKGTAVEKFTQDLSHVKNMDLVIDSLMVQPPKQKRSGAVSRDPPLTPQQISSQIQRDVKTAKEILLAGGKVLQKLYPNDQSRAPLNQISFGVEFELIARGEDDLKGSSTRQDQQQKVKKRWRYLNRALTGAKEFQNLRWKEWLIDDNETVHAIKEFSDEAKIKPKLGALYSEKERTGVGVEFVSPPLEGYTGLEELVAFLAVADLLGVQANPSGGFHVHINAFADHLGTHKLKGKMTLDEYLSVLFGWVENQVAINAMQKCTRLLKPYAVTLYADQAPVRDWFPQFHDMARKGLLNSDEPELTVLRALNPYVPEYERIFEASTLRTKFDKKDPEKRKFMYENASTCSPQILALLEDKYVKEEWRRYFGCLHWRPAFNYDSSTGIFEYNEETSLFDWTKMHGSIEIRQRAGTNSIVHSLRWIQFLTALFHFYKQPEQVAIMKRKYWDPGTFAARAHADLVESQRSRTLESLVKDLQRWMPSDSLQYIYSYKCNCPPDANGKLNVVCYDPADDTLYDT